MTFDPTGAQAIIPNVERLPPIYADFVGDRTAGGSIHLQTYIDARRNYRGEVANVAARNALASLVDGDWVIVLDGGSGQRTLDVYRSSGATWETLASGLGNGGTPTYKTPVTAATTAALPTNTRSGNVLTASANGALPAIDDVTMVVNERVLVKNEATGANNGVYVVTSLGSVGTPWVLTRASDADTSAEVLPSTLVLVEEGTTLADTGWILSSNSPITLNTTSLTFVRFAADATTLSGYGANTGTTASTIPVRDGTGKVPGDITGNAATATNATQLGGVVAADYQTRALREFASLFAIGDLTAFVGLDFVDTWIAVSAATLRRVLVTADKTPASGNLTIELRTRSGGGALTAGATTAITGGSITLAANGGKAFSVTTLGSPAALAANDIVLVKITAAAAGFEDLRIGFFE